MTRWQAFLALFQREQTDKNRLDDHERRIIELETILSELNPTQFKADVEQLIGDDKASHADDAVKTAQLATVNQQLADAEKNQLTAEEIATLKATQQELHDYLHPPVEAGTSNGTAGTTTEATPTGTGS